MNHYETLGVSRDASPADIKRAYRRLAQNAHPDREGGDVDQMRGVQEAYDCLGDPAKRAAYDADDTVDEDSIDSAARLILADYFAKYLRQLGHGSNLRNFVLRDLELAERTHRCALDLCPITKRRYEGWKGRFVNKHGDPNIVEHLVEDLIAEVDLEVSTLKRNLEMNARMRELLDDYVDTGIGGVKITFTRGGL